MLDAVCDVVAQDFFLDTPQRCTRCGDLRHDVDAITIVIHHASDPADLAFDPVQALETGRLDVFSHMFHIPPEGI